VAFVDRAFAPYGETYNNIGTLSNDESFTGDRQDIAAGTYDTPNRELNPNQGRWISPDPVHSGWNAYSYTTNPLGAIDPGGLSATAAPLCNCGSFGDGDGVFITDDGGAWDGQGLGNDTWGTTGGGLTGYLNSAPTGVGSFPSVNEQTQEALGMVAGDSNWTPMLSLRGGPSLGAEGGDGEQGAPSLTFTAAPSSPLSSAGYAFPLSVARGGYKWYQFFTKLFDRAYMQRRLNDELEVDQSIEDITFMSIANNPMNFPGQFIQIFQLEEMNIQVFDVGRRAGKLMSVVPNPPGVDSFGDTVFDYYGQLRDANNAQIDMLLQEAAAAIVH